MQAELAGRALLAALLLHSAEWRSRDSQCRCSTPALLTAWQLERQAAAELAPSHCRLPSHWPLAQGLAPAAACKERQKCESVGHLVMRIYIWQSICMRVVKAT